METVGSRQWLWRVEREWERRGIRADRRIDFDPAIAFRRDTLREASALRPRRWWGGMPWILHDREQRSALSPKFVNYLDNSLEMHTWRERLHFLRHQPLQFWQDQLDTLDDSRLE